MPLWQTPTSQFTSVLSPAGRVAVVGDIHGCAHLLNELLNQIDKHAPDQLVFVGNYIDRGEDSAQVLDRLIDLSRETRARITFLKGRHEDMLLRFLGNPGKHGPAWLRHGGLQTLASFGIGRGLGTAPNEAQLFRTRDELRRALGAKRRAWLRWLRLSHETGNVAVVPAGAAPSKPIPDQSEETLIWGHRDFLTRKRKDGIWVVHGHRVVDTVAITHGRICVDTGAYASGLLSAALIGNDSLEILSARG